MKAHGFYKPKPIFLDPEPVITWFTVAPSEKLNARIANIPKAACKQNFAGHVNQFTRYDSNFLWSVFEFRDFLSLFHQQHTEALVLKLGRISSVDWDNAAVDVQLSYDRHTS